MKPAALLLLVALNVNGQVVASWERNSDATRIMANGQKFNPSAMTCATWLYPLGTKLLITESHNGSQVVVTVTDRTARRFAATRIDLSPAAFSKLDDLPLGICQVRIDVLRK